MTKGKLLRYSAVCLAIWLATATSGQATFLSSDPVGTKDDPNLYLYVGLDPVNRMDPTGKTCIEVGTTRNRTYSCKIDWVRDRNGEVRAPTAAENRQFASFNENYTRAVNQLMANPNRRVPITIPGPGPASSRSFTVSAREVGSGLIRRQFTAIPSRDGGAQTDRGHTYVYAQGLRGQGIVGRDTALGQRVLVVHEGIHRRPAENGMLIAPRLGHEPWDTNHQDPYNDAARVLLGE
ncbi:hypothetical protein [Brevundimonas sp.]|uniref:hypothetical protein n=1 Tax=Brevundimonas sp. TaxID=1871086 RepID=UPI002D7395A5|nr:hypothetical protein [Brevundimonas sp.]HYC74669.1 hypothetical protein [Brevundimonas sp.]